MHLILRLFIAMSYRDRPFLPLIEEAVSRCSVHNVCWLKSKHLSKCRKLVFLLSRIVVIRVATALSIAASNCSDRDCQLVIEWYK